MKRRGSIEASYLRREFWTPNTFPRLDVDTIDDYDELEDDERDALENILSDPKRFKLFTTAKSLPEIESEAAEVKRLFQMADALYKNQQEEQKYKKLRELLTSE